MVIIVTKYWDKQFMCFLASPGYVHKIPFSISSYQEQNWKLDTKDFIKTLLYNVEAIQNQIIELDCPLIYLTLSEFHSLIKTPYDSFYDGTNAKNKLKLMTGQISDKALSRFLYKYFTISQVYDRNNLLSHNVHTFLMYSEYLKKCTLVF